MAKPPGWGFDVDAVTRWVAGYGLRNRLTGPVRPLTADDWVAVRAACTRHRLDGLLVAAVADDVLPTTADQRAELAERELGLTGAGLAAEERLAAVVAVLDRAGVEVRVLKGLALAHLDYPDPQWRPTTDVDLLVRPTDIEGASALLVAAGGERIDPEPRAGVTAEVAKGATVHMPAGFEADLHRILVWGPVGVRLDPTELWRTARPFAIAGRTFRGLGREETLVHLCLHLLVGGERRFLGVRDVAQLLAAPDLDPERAVAVAGTWGATAALAKGVLMAQRELALPGGHPLAGWAEHEALSVADLLALRIDRPEAPWGPLQAPATFASLRTGRQRRLLAAATLRPAPGTWPSPAARLGRVARRGTGRLGRWRSSRSSAAPGGRPGPSPHPGGR